MVSGWLATSSSLQVKKFLELDVGHSVWNMSSLKIIQVSIKFSKTTIFSVVLCLGLIEDYASDNNEPLTRIEMQKGRKSSKFVQVEYV